MYVNDPCYQDDIETEEVPICLLCEEEIFWKSELEKGCCDNCQSDPCFEEYYEESDKKPKFKLVGVEHGPDEDELYEIKAGK